MMALLFHTLLNLSTYVLFPVFETKTGPGVYVLLLIVLSVVIVSVYGKKKLTRKILQV